MQSMQAVESLVFSIDIMFNWSSVFFLRVVTSVLGNATELMKA